MTITMPDGRVFSGTPIQIVRGMKDIAFDRQSSTDDEYIDWVARNAESLYGVGVTIEGNDTEARAASLVSELVRTGLARR